MTTDTHDIQKEVKRYIIVFMSLMFLTIVTVAISYLKLSVVHAVILALIVASIKASLVACYFMHLISEQKFIYLVLIMTAIFFIFVFILPISGFLNNIPGTQGVA